MSGESSDVPDGEPFVVRKGVEETGGEFVRLEGTVHPSPDGSGATDDLPHRRYLIDNPDEHVHPHQEERVEVVAGEYRVAIDGTEHVLSEGDEITVPTATPHRHWNPTDRPVRVVHEHRPARETEALFETFYALAQAGRTDEKGVPNPLQFAVINDAYPGHAYTTALPIGVQKALFTLLAPIGRLVGYEATHSRDDIDRLG